jgi:aldehyde:ferredoxin oxidoreductase
VRYVFTKEMMIWPVRLAELLNLTTGAAYTPEEALQAAERVYNLERLFLIKAGSGPEQDTLSPRLLNEPLPEGPAKGKVVELEKMLPGYYRARGWDEQGIPTSEKLAELGLVA